MFRPISFVDYNEESKYFTRHLQTNNYMEIKMKNITTLFLFFSFVAVINAQSQQITYNDRNLVSTFSIVGLDPETGELGVAVASRFFRRWYCCSLGCR